MIMVDPYAFLPDVPSFTLTRYCMRTKYVQTYNGEAPDSVYTDEDWHDSKILSYRQFLSYMLADKMLWSGLKQLSGEMRMGKREIIFNLTFEN